MYAAVSDAGIVFTAIGVVTSDPASVESVLTWAARLQSRTAYLIVENCISVPTDFTYWRESEQALQFQKMFAPAVIHMDYRLPDLENAVRNHGVTLGEWRERNERAGIAESLAGHARPKLPAPHVCGVREGEGVAVAMNTEQNNDSFNDDLIDSIANGMPVERRVDYYREMRRLRSLRHDDEMLHILKIMQFPMSMMVGIPQRLAMEREKLERATGECMVLLQQTNERLARLPEEVAGGISAEAIAEKITPKIVAAHRHAAHEAVSAVREMKSAISEVTTTARQATAELSSTYLHEYRWALGVLLVLALVLRFLFGVFLEGSGYLPSFEPTHETAPAAIPRTRR
jgi:hypothetical protein